jgi:hypothetical protein
VVEEAWAATEVGVVSWALAGVARARAVAAEPRVSEVRVRTTAAVGMVALLEKVAVAAVAAVPMVVVAVMVATEGMVAVEVTLVVVAVWVAVSVEAERTRGSHSQSSRCQTHTK